MAKKLKTDAAVARFAKLAETVAKEQKSVERTEIIPIDSIIMNRDNIFSTNDTEESINELAKNIEENGLLHNIVVTEIEPDKYLLISGERRTKAVKALGRDKIKATIKTDLSEFEILKMLFFANSETREYTTEEKINIIQNFLTKIDEFEDKSDKEALKKFREYVSQAFNINDRQASKLITITSELTEPLKQLLYDDMLDINTAASLAQLPPAYQEYATDIINQALSKNTPESKKTAVDNVLTFSKQAKNVISKTNNALAKSRTSRSYHNSRMIQAGNELNEIEKELESPEITTEKTAELINKKNETQTLIDKYAKILEHLDREIDNELEKQNQAIQKIYDQSVITEKKDNTEPEKIKSVAIDKEIQKAEKAIRTLIALNPAEELSVIKDLLERYKNTLI